MCGTTDSPTSDAKTSLPSSSSLREAAHEAVKRHPDSALEIGMEFCQSQCPSFVGTSCDRLVKVGRSIQNLVQDMADDQGKLEKSLKGVVQECELIMSGKVKVPRVPFGKTGLDISIVTLGCMRFQAEWGPRITNMNMVGSDCQDNLVAILKTAILDYGINHIETARGYGCSELQLGAALKQLFLTTSIKREDLLIQTKVIASKDPKEFRQNMESSFKNLQVDYFDLFSIHGLNLPVQYDWVFGKEEKENCLTVVKEYMQAGKIRHLGFSTHGSTEHILKCIQTNVFEYVNLHYHFFGSYTASGGGHDGKGNLDCVKLLTEKNMGVFIISPFDKGGRLYGPSRKLRQLTLPEMEPIDFGSQWIWNHHNLAAYPGLQLHTYTVGAGRPSDLDQPAVAAYLYATRPDETQRRVETVAARLEAERNRVLGEEWAANWWKGLPKASDSEHCVEHNQIVWLYVSIKAFGLYDFAKNRYTSFEGNAKDWDYSKTSEENIEKLGLIKWGYVPGLPLIPGTDYSMDLIHVPEENKLRVQAAEEFVYKWLASKKDLGSSPAEGDNTPQEEGVEKEEPIPKEWETAYDMRPWPDYPDQPSRK